MFNNCKEPEEEKLKKFHDIFKKQVNYRMPKTFFGGFFKKSQAFASASCGLIVGSGIVLFSAFALSIAPNRFFMNTAVLGLSITAESISRIDEGCNPSAYCYKEALSKFKQEDSDHRKLKLALVEEERNQGFFGFIFGGSKVSKKIKNEMKNLDKYYNYLFVNYRPKYVAKHFNQYEEKLKKISKISYQNDLNKKTGETVADSNDLEKKETDKKFTDLITKKRDERKEFFNSI